jgi:hypothetical protein
MNSWGWFFQLIGSKLPSYKKDTRCRSVGEQLAADLQFV